LSMSEGELHPRELTAAPASLEPGVRFRLRAMLLLTTASALLAAALGPAYRTAPPEARPGLLGFWGAILSVFAGYLLLQWRGQCRRLSRAGPICFSLQRPDCEDSSPLRIFLTCCQLIFGVGVLGLAGLSAVGFTSAATRSADGMRMLPAAILGGMMGFLMTAAIHFLRQPFLDPRPMLLGERGVIVRRRVLPWERFKRASWNHLLPNWLMLYGSGRTYAAAVPEAMRADVEAFVQTKTRFEKDERKLAPGY
jgi:multisubunit Na+/H+ antiporter MnhB subunit